MGKIKLILSVCLAATLALILFFVPMLLMLFGARSVLGSTHISDGWFLITILVIAGISFAFSWWFDSKFKIYKTASSIVEKILKTKP